MLNSTTKLIGLLSRIQPRRLSLQAATPQQAIDNPRSQEVQVVIQILLRNKMARAIKRRVEPYEKSIEIKSKSSKAHILKEVDLFHRPLRLFHQKDRIVPSHQQANSRLRRSRRMYGLVRLEMRRLLLYKTLSSLTMLSHLLI